MIQHKKLIPFLLSAFFLPGLGQVYLKRRKKGWFFILVSLATVILTFAKYMMGLLKVTQNHPHLRLTYNHISSSLLEAFWMEKNSIFIGIGTLFLVWFLSILDIFQNKKSLS